MARPDKTAAVEDIRGRFGESNAALLTEYRGLTVTEIAEVRGALREADADYKVLKNTLVRIAARESGLEELAGLLTGPTAIAFVRGDAVAAAKALDDAAKRFPVLVVKGGVLKGKILDADQARALATIESREVLLAKIAMLVNQPAQQTINVLSALLRNLGSMLAQVVEKKESGELPGGTGEPAAEPAAPSGEPIAQAAPEEVAEDSAPGGAVAPEAEEPPAELPEAVDQAPAAPEAEVTDATPDEESASKEE
ncbi:MAG: 50S ribosomal protein L10 [Actinomycetota bacterium]|nr:50S ribosomal protein L10 [Actinomycetota bacterium]